MHRAASSLEMAERGPTLLPPSKPLAVPYCRALPPSAILKLCSPTTEEYKDQAFQKDEIRKPNKFKVLPLD